MQMHCQILATTRFAFRFGISLSSGVTRNRNQVHRARLLFSTSLSSSHSKSASTSDVLQERIRRGELRYDSAQEQAARRLTKLQNALVDYDANNIIEHFQMLQDQKEQEDQQDSVQDNIKDRQKELNNKNEVLNRDTPLPSIEVPRGLFLHGDVGTGKSMLMDTFFQEALVKKKRRVHFHSFMQDVHKRIHALKQLDLKKHGRSFHVDVSKERNPIYRVAHQLAAEVTLLCFDEFQVTDVADALILSQLFFVLFSAGTVMVATSNRPPLDLYEGGINRGYFLPFIDLLNRHCIVHHIKSNLDYRRLLSKGMDQFFLVDTAGDDDFSSTRSKCDDIFLKLLNGRRACSIDLEVGFNRTLVVPQADPSRLVGRFDFKALCDKELGSSDYRCIAQHFSIIILERVPVLTLQEHNQARRFITLVDELYEGKCALLCSAVASPENLFADGHGNSRAKAEVSGVEIKVGKAFGIDVAQSNVKTTGKLASVRELSFAFKRASSRLTEMCSQKWWDNALVE